jgi:Tfp pilus assembly protein PilN
MLAASESSSAVSIGAVVSVLGAAAALLGVYLSRKSSKEAQDTQEQLNDYTILRGVVDALRAEVGRLNASLDRANVKADRLNQELDTARANVLVLSAHIRQYIPEVPFPRLRAMNDVE